MLNPNRRFSILIMMFFISHRSGRYLSLKIFLFHVGKASWAFDSSICCFAQHSWFVKNKAIIIMLPQALWSCVFLLDYTNCMMHFYQVLFFPLIHCYNEVRIQQLIVETGLQCMSTNMWCTILQWGYATSLINIECFIHVHYRYLMLYLKHF